MLTAITPSWIVVMVILGLGIRPQDGVKSDRRGGRGEGPIALQSGRVSAAPHWARSAPPEPPEQTRDPLAAAFSAAPSQMVRGALVPLAGTAEAVTGTRAELAFQMEFRGLIIPNVSYFPVVWPDICLSPLLWEFGTARVFLFLIYLFI